MASDAIDIVDDLLDWEDPRQVKDKITQVCSSVPEEFWDLWKEHKDELREHGIRVVRDDDEQFLVTRVTRVGDDLIAPAERELKVTRFIKAPKACAVKWPHLHPDQRDAVYTIHRAINLGADFTLDASDAGIGKTWINLQVVRELGLNFGVVCPANVVTKWTDTAIAQFDLEPEFVMSYDKLRTGGWPEFVERANKTWRGRPRVEYTWSTVDKVVVIFDEVHYCSGEKSLNSKLLQGAILDPNITVLALSATSADSPLDLKTLGYGLGLHQLRNYWQWCKQMGCRPGPFGGLTFSTGTGQRKLTPNQRRARAKLAAIHGQIFPAKGVRIVVGDSALWRPKNMVMAELVDVDFKHPKLQDALDAIDLKEEADEERAMAKKQAVAGFTTITRDRQRAELLKLPYFLERIVDLRQQGNSVVVFLNFSASIELLASWVKEEHVLIVGGMGNERDVSMRRFQANEVRVVICQTDAGAQSIDLDDTRGDFPRCVLLSPGYDAKKFYQALGRGYRPATTKSIVRQWVIFAVGGVEERVGRIVQAKLNGQALINDGDLAGVTTILK